MTNQEINIAFIKALKDFADTNNLEVIYENTSKSITNYPAIELHFMPNNPEFPTLGTNGRYYNEGVFQVTVIDIENIGNGRALNVCNSIEQAFKRNDIIDDTNIKIIKSYSSNGFPDSKTSKYRIPVTIEYQSWNV